VLAKLANKWSLLVIDALDGGPTRNGALLRRVQGISQKMLTETLRELEDLNLLVRRSRNTVPPHVEYELTPLGRSLRALVCQLDRWVEEHLGDVRALGAVPAGTR
jgi:DNA-binding HxlR family transcriptional regulator